MNGSAVPAGVIADAVAAAKTYLRVEGSGEDALLVRLATAAIGHGEAYCGAVLVARSFSDDLATRRRWQRLPACPVTAIDTVEAVPGGALPIASYGIDIDADGVGWVRTLLPVTATRLRIGYRAGAAATWDAI
ncbi:MAG TPA: hypothetical protein VM900_09250, partial [Sphingomonas sp.]|nr:hypothetical protein [Sphingomonas sp.]